MDRFVKFGLFIFVSIFLVGCASTKTTRMDTTTVTDLSGTWNDTDARLTAEEMVQDALNGQWIWDFNQKNGRPPVVIVGTIRNKTMEHIDPEVFVSTIEKVLIGSGKVQFVAAKDARQEIRAERDDQANAGYTEPSTIVPKGHETGADFMMQGSINAIEEGVENRSMVVSREKTTSFYQVNLELVDLRTNQKRWIGQKSVKKMVQRKKVF